MDDDRPAPDAVLAEAQARADALEAQLRTLQRDTEQRLIHAELKAEALRAGMLDLDGLKLLDLSAAKLTTTGEVEGAAALMARMRQEKPWLFLHASSSPTATPPQAATVAARHAMTMTEAEYRTARAELIKRRHPL